MQQQVEIRLDPNGVAAPAQRAAAIAAQVVAAGLAAFETGELEVADARGEAMAYRFNLPAMTSDERRAMYQNWLLSKGFQDLARGIRETLEQAALYMSFANRPPQRPVTLGQLRDEFGEATTKAAKLGFPALLSQVNAGLTTPLSFEAEFLSIQKARNCLEHRNGIVGEQDLTDGASAARRQSG